MPGPADPPDPPGPADPPGSPDPADPPDPPDPPDSPGSPGSPAIRRQRGWARYRRGEYDAALADFGAALAADPGDYDAVLGAGRCHRLLGDYDAAIGDFTRAAELRPGAARPLAERGAILILQHAYAAALADYEAARRAEPAYPGLRSYFAELYLYTGRAAQALTLSQQALLDEPGDLMHDINIAHAHLLLGHTGEALDRYARLAGRFHSTKSRNAADLVLDDLRLIQAAGIDVPDAGLVQAALLGPAPR